MINIIISIISSISGCLCLLSLHNYFNKDKKNNISFIIINIWLFICSLIYFINSIIWKNNNKPINDIYCYISGSLLNAIDYGFFFSITFITYTIYKCTKKIEKSKKKINYVTFKVIIMIIIPIAFSIIMFLLRHYNYSIRYIVGCNVILPKGFIKFILHDIILLILNIISILFWVISVYRILTVKKIRLIIENNINFYIYIHILLFCVIYTVFSLIGTIYMINENLTDIQDFFNLKDIRKDLDTVLTIEEGPNLDDYFSIITGIILFVFTNINEIKKLFCLKYFNKTKMNF